MKRGILRGGAVAGLILSIGCSVTASDGESTTSSAACKPGASNASWVPGATTTPACDGAVPPPSQDEVQAEIAALAGLTTEGLLTAHDPQLIETLSYDPLQADLSLVQSSGLALDDDELARLGTDGFVITPRLSYPTFGYGYESVYALDLPVFISADSILFALHRSFGKILQTLEKQVFAPALKSWITEVRQRLAACAHPMNAGVVRDLDLFLTVAASLLEGEVLSPVAGADPAAVADLVAKVAAARELAPVSLFGTAREVDFSQFVVRGHYADEPELAGYFPAMMWLGTVDFRLLVPDGDALLLRREAVDAAALLYSLVGEDDQASYDLIHRSLGKLVGPNDDMTLPQVGLLLRDLKVSNAAAFAALDDDTVKAALLSGGYGVQAIASGSHVGGKGAPLAQPHTLRVFGQRFVADSQVLSQVVYDRVQPPLGGPLRMMPSPLDVAFAAFGNDQAAHLLTDELSTYEYADELAGARVLFESHGCELQKGSVYHNWLDALGGLSPAKPWPQGLPDVAKTDKWGRRILSSQLASWAELRHDTLLYAKQSYTSDESCEFPDGYVDPYPAFYRSLVEVAERGREIAAMLEDPAIAGPIDGYFHTFASIASQLEAIATSQLEGQLLTAEQLAFINQTVALDGCGDPTGVSGWYGRLFYDSIDAIQQDPTIADVHTQPTLDGDTVGHVLHVATGLARTMVVTVDTCVGPRAYVGPVSSYYEIVTKDFERLTDADWANKLTVGEPPEPSWMGGVTVFE